MITEGWQERAQAELDALNEKRNALKDFIVSDAFMQLTEHTQALMEVQLDAMDLYAKVLRRRLGQ